MRALITGGAGFIGSHLAETLLNSGANVDVIDNLSTGSIRNISHLKTNSRFKYVIDTLTNEPLLAELIDRNDVVFHFAAAVGVKLIVEEPVHTIETNVHGTETVLRHASRKGVLTVIFSTSEVYGKSTAVPFVEGADLVMGPTVKHRWAYACAKALDEGGRFPLCRLPALADLFRTAGLANVATHPLEIATELKTFDDYWAPFLRGTGPAPSYVESLEAARRDALEERLRRRLLADGDGPIQLRARAWAVRGVVV